MITYSIRKAKKSDIADIAEIQQGVVEHNFVPFMGEEKAKQYYNLEEFEKYLNKNLQETSVLLNKTDLIAFSVWNKDKLEYLSVTPEHQNTIAALYFLKSLCYDKFYDYTKLYAECLEKNERANRFFEHFGWEKCGNEKGSEEVYNKIKYCLKLVDRELMKNYK